MNLKKGYEGIKTGKILYGICAYYHIWCIAGGPLIIGSLFYGLEDPVPFFSLLILGSICPVTILLIGLKDRRIDMIIFSVIWFALSGGVHQLLLIHVSF